MGQLAGTPRHELVRRYGEQRGAFLAALPLAQASTKGRCWDHVVVELWAGCMPLSAWHVWGMRFLHEFWRMRLD